MCGGGGWEVGLCNYMVSPLAFVKSLTIRQGFKLDNIIHRLSTGLTGKKPFWF